MATTIRDRATKLFHGVDAVASAVGEQALSLLERVETKAAPFRHPLGAREPYRPDDEALRRRLVTCAVSGFVGSLLIFWGASQPSSPFTVKLSPPQSAPAWFFGLRPEAVLFNQTPPPGQDFFLSLAAFYGGMVLLMRGWVRVSRLTREHPGIPLRQLAVVMATWAAPMLFVAPLLSKDAYSYVAQGEMMSRHISPYKYGPAVLGGNSNPYTDLTDPLWWNTTSPYGPLFLELAGVIQVVVNHSELASLVAFRGVALLGVGLIAVFAPRLARSFGRDPGETFVFAVMNPIVLVHLIGGEHNDALMLGLMVAGLALARERHPALGAVLVALGALVKIPAIVGVIYIGWDWAGTGAPFKERLKFVARAGAVALGVIAVVTEVVGLGWGWIGALENPDTIRSYMDPATALGLGFAKLVSAVGLGDHWHVLLTLARGGGACIAGGLGLFLLLRSRGGGSSMRALGLTMLAVVLFGPVMQPWYLAWGVILLAPVADGRLRTLLVWLTVVVTFLGVGDAQYLVLELGKANPLIVAVTGGALLALLFMPVVPRVRRGLRIVREARLAQFPQAEEAPARL